MQLSSDLAYHIVCTKMISSTKHVFCCSIDSIHSLSVANLCSVIADFCELVNAHGEDDFSTIEAVRTAASSMLAPHRVT